MLTSPAGESNFQHRAAGLAIRRFRQSTPGPMRLAEVPGASGHRSACTITMSSRCRPQQMRLPSSKAFCVALSLAARAFSRDELKD
jgi:hypothetical protein